MSTFYVAYGSNLNLSQMRFRCPSAEILGTGMLKDYQLYFCYYLTVVPQEGAEVPVAVWKIDDDCEDSLDYYEGFPNFYRKETVRVEIDGETVEAMIYIMNRFVPELPGRSYYNDVTEGYRDFKLDECYLLDALGETYMLIGENAS